MIRKFILFLLIAFYLSSCSNYVYITPSHNVPLMLEDDVLKAGVMTGLEGYSGGQVSLNVIKNISAMGQGYYQSDKNNYYEAGAGASWQFENQLILEAFGGYAQGAFFYDNFEKYDNGGWFLSDKEPTLFTTKIETMENQYFFPFLQVNLGKTNKKSENFYVFGVYSLKLCYLTFNEFNYMKQETRYDTLVHILNQKFVKQPGAKALTLENSMQLGFGYKIIEVYNQMGFTETLHNEVSDYGRPKRLWWSAGLRINIGLEKDEKGRWRLVN